MKILILYSSRDGHTRLIAEQIAAAAGGETVCDVRNLHQSEDIDPSLYRAVVIGASIRYGYFRSAVGRFIGKNQAALNAMPGAFFGVNLVARKPEKRTVETNVYVRRFLAQCPWRPQLTAVFPGALRYPRYPWYDRAMIRLIMWMTGGETDPSMEVVYTDWDDVKDFGRRFAELAEIPVAVETEEDRLTPSPA